MIRKLLFYLRFLIKRKQSYKEVFYSTSFNDGQWNSDVWYFTTFKKKFGVFTYIAKLDGNFTDVSRPALWLVNSEKFYAEVDIELMKKDNKISLHFTSYWNPLINVPDERFGCKIQRVKLTNKRLIEQLRNSFNKYTIDWDNERIKFFINDILVARMSNTPHSDMCIVVGEATIKKVTVNEI